MKILRLCFILILHLLFSQNGQAYLKSPGRETVDLIGQENAIQFCQRYINNYVTEEDIQKIASREVKSIRLLFNSAGTHSLKLLFIQSGVSINIMKYNLKSVPAKDSFRFDQITDAVFLAQDYPNLFTQITQIPVALIEPQQVNLIIFNLNGALVKHLFNNILSTGFKTIS